MARRCPCEVEVDLGKDVDVVRGIEIEEVAARGHMDIAVLELGSEVLPSALVDPERQQVGEDAGAMPRITSLDCSWYSSNGILRPSARQTYCSDCAMKTVTPSSPTGFSMSAPCFLRVGFDVRMGVWAFAGRLMATAFSACRAEVAGRFA